MLVTSIFSFFHNVFKRPLSQGSSKVRTGKGSTLLSDSKILDWSKLKAFINDKINMKKLTLFRKGKKHCGKWRKCCYQHFLFFPQCFQKASYTGALKAVIVC